MVLNLFQYMHPFEISSQFSHPLIAEIQKKLIYKVEVMCINNTTTFFLFNLYLSILIFFSRKNCMRI